MERTTKLLTARMELFNRQPKAYADAVTDVRVRLTVKRTFGQERAEVTEDMRPGSSVFSLFSVFKVQNPERRYRS